MASSAYLTPPERIEVDDVSSNSVHGYRHAVRSDQANTFAEVRRRRSDTCLEIYRGYMFDEHEDLPFWWLPRRTSAPPFLSKNSSSFQDSQSANGTFSTIGPDDQDFITNAIGTTFAPECMLQRTRIWTMGLSKAEVVEITYHILALTRDSFKDSDTPATSTLRRVSGASSPKRRGKQSVTITNNRSGTLPEKNGSENWLHHTKVRPIVMHLVRGKDVREVMHQVKAILKMPEEIQVSSVKSPESTSGDRLARRPSVTQHGLMPQPCLPPDQAVTNENVSNIPSQPQLIITEVIDGHEEPRSSRSSQDSTWFHAIQTSLETADENSDSHMSLTVPVPSHAVSPFHNLFDSSGQSLAASDVDDRATQDTRLRPHPMFQWSWTSSRDAMSSLPQSGAVTPSPSPRPPNNTPSKPTPPSSQSVSEVESFPPLKDRQRTSDWHTPLPDLDRTDCLYNAGIDAHTGPLDASAHVPHIKIQLPQKSAAARHAPPDSSTSQTLREPAVRAEPRRKSVILQHPEAQPRISDTLQVGASIGSSSRTRRRSSATSARTQTEQASSKKTSPHERISGNKPGARLAWLRLLPPADPPLAPAHLESQDGQGIGAQDRNRGTTEISGKVKETRAGGKGRRRLSLIDEIAPMLSKVDRVGIYGAMTGTSNSDTSTARGRLASVGYGAASESHPHQCGDSPTRDRQMSVDWIG
ncbi:MAG: hypothetical protein M1818_000389 [Claussenomyces sp. TS43310]|nr:MAG: hypothetical protein M1818_000389 [Claussenomyces sp. TS43310]